MTSRPGSRAAACAAAVALAVSTHALAQEAPRQPDDAHPVAWVAQLADAAKRAEARAKLVALGAPAVPALTANLERTPDLAQRLAVLVELGPAAGAAVPALVAMLPAGAHDVGLCDALAELAPWCAEPFPLAPIALDRVLHGATLPDPTGLLRGARDFTGTVALRVAHQRLRARTQAPRGADVRTLTAMLRGPNPWRVELAADLLLQRGVAARAALPELRACLERPEPVALIGGRVVPIHRKAANAVLALAGGRAGTGTVAGAGADRAADGGDHAELVALARAVLAGQPAPVRSLAVREPPEAARRRIGELVRDLADPEARAAAAANLVGFGELAAEPIAKAIVRMKPEGADAASAVLVELGPRAVAAVPHLLEAALDVAPGNLAAVAEALVAIAPWSTDVVPPLAVEIHGGTGVLVWHQVLVGAATLEQSERIFAATRALDVGLAIDPKSTPVELAAWLAHPDAAHRERALALSPALGAAARPLLPALAGMLAAPQPTHRERHFVVGGAIHDVDVDRTDAVRRLAARAILAIAPPDDPLRAHAQAVLGAATGK